MAMGGQREIIVRLTAELPPDLSGHLTIGLQRGDELVDPVASARVPC